MTQSELVCLLSGLPQTFASGKEKGDQASQIHYVAEDSTELQIFSPLRPKSGGTFWF